MEKVSELLFKYVKGTLRADEMVVLEKWADTDIANREIVQKLDKDEELLTDIKEWYEIPAKSLLDDRRLYQEIVKYDRRNSKRRVLRWLPYAAAALLVLALGYFFLESANKLQEKQTTIAEILPGSNRAVLTLSDGREVVLSEAYEGIVVEDGIKYHDGSKIIDDDLSFDSTDVPVDYYELSTPKGGAYRVTLTDGSKVWLNASSRLKYPAKFGNKERVVELEGEAYFEVVRSVSKANLPFKVISNNQTLEVLGTEFNVTAYPEEGTRTTLVKGAVQIASHRTKEVNTLAPGEQALIRETDVVIRKVDVRQYIGWKDGKIVLEGRTLPEILREVSRWYDIEIRYEGVIPQGTFFGRVDRNSRLETVLRLLESANMDYQMEGRTLIVKARRN